MNITVTAKYDLTFTVEEFTATEGGMDHDSYGDEVKTIEEAVFLRELALSSHGGKSRDWIIVCHVNKTMEAKK